MAREDMVRSEDVTITRQNNALRAALRTTTKLATNVLPRLSLVTQAGPRRRGGILRTSHGG